MTTRDADGDVPRTAGEPADEGPLSRVGSGSTVLASARSVGDRVASAVRASWLYRWLTADPDPEVIVIDLRETWTVGPFLRVLDWVIASLVGAMEGSILAGTVVAAVTHVRETPLRVAGGLAVGAGSVAFLVAVAGDPVSRTLLAGALALYVVGAVGLRDRRSWAELRDTRPVELLVRALEPPAPPDAADESVDPQTSPDPVESTGSGGIDVSTEDAEVSGEDEKASDEDEETSGEAQPELFGEDPSASSTDAEPTLFPEDPGEPDGTESEAAESNPTEPDDAASDRPADDDRS
ncbi:hypothetical protein DQW50_12900 [Halorubrum sp. 48-1-W]|uniref:hypothetical protein n=1 Tax=Halorubrum sp. 48-1-W TaxID=2249761 RepID=UPI000DCD7262|nr:hypothetical protein [Halorubrum sp. 48-1-W]RAW44742.1 hypothetical protein DQW50_12900 [Halorubrum sp. 48-1-W]